MQNDRARQIAEQLLALKRSAQPLAEEIECLNEELRQLVAENHNQRIEVSIPGLGVVHASAASPRRLRGVEDVLNMENWLKMDESERDRLRELKVVESVEIYTNARKS